MGKIDTEKEKISLAKFALGILVSLIFALAGWITSVYKVDDGVLILLGFVLIVVFIYSSVFLLKYIIFKIESLGGVINE